MDLTFYITLLLLAAFSKAEDRGMLREEENNDQDDGDDKYAYEESFSSPFYGSSNVLRPAGLNGKSAYNVPAVPSSYLSYLSSLGLGNPYAYGLYSRYGAMPYSTPAAFGYGSFLNNPGFASALAPGLGYSGYGSPYFGRYGYPGFGYGYPGYFSGVGYPAGALKRGPAPVVTGPATFAGPVARAASIGPIPSAPGIPAPMTNAIAGLPPPVLPYRAPYRAVQSKDGSVRYVATGIQNLPAY